MFDKIAASSSFMDRLQLYLTKSDFQRNISMQLFIAMTISRVYSKTDLFIFYRNEIPLKNPEIRAYVCLLCEVLLMLTEDQIRHSMPGTYFVTLKVQSRKY